MGQKDIERTVQILKHLLETGEIDPAMRIKAEEKVRILQEELAKLKGRDGHITTNRHLQKI
jgi:hypothetical protein